MGINEALSAGTVFLQGLLSFLSPCVLPLIPVYMGYLASGGKSGEQSKRSRTIINTVCFAVGIALTFFVLGLGFTAAGSFLSKYKQLFAIIGGILIIIFGIIQLIGSEKITFLAKEHKLKINFTKLSMNPLVALLFGFAFSFAWTPCVGPTLTSVLIMAAGENSAATGFMYIGIYTVGFILPLLLLGFFTTAVLEFFKKHKSIVKYTAKIGAILLIIMGLLMITGVSNMLSGFLGGTVTTEAPNTGSSVISSQEAGFTDDNQDGVSSLASEEVTANSSQENESSETSSSASSAASSATSSASKPTASSSASSSQTSKPASSQSSASSSKPSASSSAPATTSWGSAPDFELIDQNGNKVKLSQYKGKTILLNVWATWCGYCKQEMPDLQNIYEKYGSNQKDVVILAICSSDATDASHRQTLSSLGVTFPSVIDRASVINKYGITGYPNTFIIDKEGDIITHIPGYVSQSYMESCIERVRNM